MKTTNVTIATIVNATIAAATTKPSRMKKKKVPRYMKIFNRAKESTQSKDS